MNHDSHRVDHSRRCPHPHGAGRRFSLEETVGAGGDEGRRVCPKVSRAKHYSLIDAEIEEYDDFIVSTQWRIKNTLRDRFDLVVVEKWAEEYAHRKKCFESNMPYYAAEYKVDDEQGRYGKGDQIDGFRDDVVRLDRNCGYLQRAFALYYYRGPMMFHGSAFDKNSSNYLFKNRDEIINKEKLNVYVVDRLDKHKLDLK